MIGWMYAEKPDIRVDYAGALSIPRELKLIHNRVVNYPVKEAHPLLTSEDDMVAITKNSVSLLPSELSVKYEAEINDVAILRDMKTIEVFINGGEASFSHWFAK